MDAFEFNQLIESVSLSYGIEPATIVSCVNLVLLKNRGRAFPTTDFIEWDPNRGVTVFSNQGATLLGGIGRGIRRLLLHDLMDILSHAPALRDYELLRPHFGGLVQVRITGQHAGGLSVVLLGTGVYGEQLERFHGLIPKQKQSPRDLETGYYKIDRTMWVTLDKVSIINRNGVPAVLPMFGRVSKALPQKLLERAVSDKDYKCVCVSRVAGRRCDLLANRRTDSEKIQGVRMELGERIRVRYMDFGAMAAVKIIAAQGWVRAFELAGKTNK